MRALNLLFAGFAIAMTGCASVSDEMDVVDHVDIDRFMGDWYVIASIPTFLEDEAYNAVERYDLNPDGTIATTFTFRDGSFDGEKKTYTPTGFVTDDESNAIWGMRFIWPIKADYRIVYLDESYTKTIIGRNKRDYVWIMARTPTIADTEYEMLVDRVAKLGYELNDLRRVPQRW